MCPRKKYTSEFKIQVVLETFKNDLTTKQIASKFSVHPNRVSEWKKLLMDELPAVFEKGSNEQKVNRHLRQVQILFNQIEQLEIEQKWLKKKLFQPQLVREKS